MNRNFSSIIDRYKHQQIWIGSVSPQQISAWANKILPNGEIVREVTKPYTFHYETNKPEKYGLFCERICGSTWEFNYIALTESMLYIWKRLTSFLFSYYNSLPTKPLFFSVHREKMEDWYQQFIDWNLGCCKNIITFCCRCRIIIEFLTLVFGNFLFTLCYLICLNLFFNK